MLFWLLHAGVTSSDEYSRVIPFLAKTIAQLPWISWATAIPINRLIRINSLDHARTAMSFLDRLGITKAAVAGQHFGGKVALEMAVTWPERVSKLILSSIGYPEAEKENIAPCKILPPPVELKMDGSHVMEWWRRSAMWGHPVNIVKERFLEYVKAGPRGEEIHWQGALTRGPSCHSCAARR